MKTDLPFTPPFRVISSFKSGNDAHIADAADSIIVESSVWHNRSFMRHKEAMELIAKTLNDRFSSDKSDRQRLLEKLRDLLENNDIIDGAKPEVVAFLKEFDP